MPQNILNTLLLRNSRTNLVRNKFLKSLESEFAEEFLEVLLNLMGFMLLIDEGFRRNIKGFNGRYQFKSKDNSITMAAVFGNDRMKVSEKVIERPNITVIFKDGKALMNFLLSPKPDILGSLLRQDVALDGNLNYLYKFAYMSNRLRLMATGGL